MNEAAASPTSMTKLLARAVAICVAFAAASAVLTACLPQHTGVPGSIANPEAALAGDDWVVISFDETEARFDVNVMDALLATELAADKALVAAGAGFIDGNEIGDNRYELFFIGRDRNEMWAILEPIFDAAPVQWTTVELLHGLDDPRPTVLIG